MGHQPHGAAYEKWRLTFSPTRTWSPDPWRKKGYWGMGSEGSAYVSQKLSCIREEEGGSLGRRNSAVPVQQRKNKAKYPVLIFWKTLFQLHPAFLLRRLWLASLFPCALFSQDLICSFPRSQRLGIWDRSKNKLSECNCHPSLVLGFGTELEYSQYLAI